MGRFAVVLAVFGLLAGCHGTATTADEEGGVAAAAVSTQSANDHRIAKQVFGALATPSAGTPSPIGSYARGCQAGAVQLPETGPTWQAMRLSRNRNWAQPETISFLEDLSAYAATLPGWNGLYIGDMSQPRGGPMLTGHASHQVGLDADVWLLPPDRLNLTRAEREAISSINLQRAGGAYVNSNWTPEVMALLRHAAEDPRVARIFIFPGAKVQMCKDATGDRSWLNKIRPWYGHNTHFHVRLLCPPGATNCVPQAPPPPGDGCADAEKWVADILHPPPPRPRDPNAPPPPPPRGPLQMAELPGQCEAVAQAN
ncbi:MAG: penicillin-insensitive murein endopeptidase [Limimaricola sp.]|uniref:penicillin-insensitive murein endopeptidase n=1 Tax=Limimaricola sp. TaxID=2211665 RepID=UPI001D722AFD|nr:penicillin-insensitive murein endopeptidase [Limimaricola sp.]MBI1418864.1 penicillin-insensitive murein endopeptidase [Limimaricola sp.]